MSYDLILNIYTDFWEDKAGNKYKYYFIGYSCPHTLHNARFWCGTHENESDIWTEELVLAWTTKSSEQVETQIALLEAFGNYAVEINNAKVAKYCPFRNELKSIIY